LLLLLLPATPATSLAWYLLQRAQRCHPLSYKLPEALATAE
jgi:hypothetical protein